MTTEGRATPDGPDDEQGRGGREGREGREGQRADGRSGAFEAGPDAAGPGATEGAEETVGGAGDQAPQRETGGRSPEGETAPEQPESVKGPENAEQAESPGKAENPGNAESPEPPEEGTASHSQEPDGEAGSRSPAPAQSSGEEAPAQAPHGEGEDAPEPPEGATASQSPEGGAAAGRAVGQGAGTPGTGPYFGRPLPRARGRSNHESWSLRLRVTSLLTAVAVVLVVAVSVITLAAVQARDSLNLQVDSLTPAVGAVEQTRASYLSQDHALRGYILTEDRDFLQPYVEARLNLLEQQAELTQLAEDNPEVAANVRELLRAGETWTEEFADPALEQVGDGEIPSQEDLQRGRVLFLELNRISDATSQQLQEEIEEARSGLTLATQQVVALLVLVGLVVVFLSVFLWVMLQQWVLRPLEELAGHMHQVSEGFYAHRITLYGPPEIVRLGQDVDAMRERIVQDLDEVDDARKKLQEQSVLLESQTEELRRSNLELEQFAYVASHDLQEPLRKIASFVQLLQRRYQGQLDERADSYIHFAVEGAKRMQTLINDLLAFSRVGRTKNFARVDLNEAFGEAMNSLSTRLEEAGAEVAGDTMPTVEGDRTLLTQVFFNLVGNAVKFRGEEPPRVHVSVRREGDEWIFCCADNGIGIEPQYADRIFVIFQRLHTKDKYSGTGIGLSMCKKIVEFHGGRIWLDAVGGDSARTGTRICWSLPVASESEEDGETAEDSRGSESAGTGAGPERGAGEGTVSPDSQGDLS